MKRSDPRARTCLPWGRPLGLSQPSGGDAFFLTQVFLSTRRGAWILNRVGDQGYPIDTILTTRMKVFLQMLLGLSMASDYAEKQMSARFDHSHYGLKPKHRCQQKLPLPRRDPLAPCHVQPHLAISLLPGPRLGLRHQAWKPS